MPLSRMAWIAVAAWWGSGALDASPARADGGACQELAGRFVATQADMGPPQRNALLFRASDEDCVQLAARLLEVGASPLSRDRFGAMPLTHAAKAGQVGMVRLLLDRGAEIDARDVHGSTALFAAVDANRATVAALLIDRGANTNLAGRSDITPLIAAAFTGNDATAELLLHHGADARARDSTGKPAIVYAAARGFTPLVQRLLDTGIDVNARYGNDLTVLMWAAGHAADAKPDAALALVNMLLDRGAHVDDTDNRGRTALMIASELDHKAIVATLEQHGADPALRDKDGHAAADLAAK